jgi:hypothetical protein
VPSASVIQVFEIVRTLRLKSVRIRIGLLSPTGRPQ